MNPTYKTAIKKHLGRTGWKLLLTRQKVVNRILTALYGTPMQVLPAGHVGLAGALVLWVAQNGGRQMIFIRNPKGKDTRARLTSFYGLGKAEDMAQAMQQAARTQLGETFCKSLKINKLALDKVAAAPMFTYTDEDNGIVTPVQTLVWVQQVQPLQLDLLELQPDHQLVLVPEQVLRNSRPNDISPTHIAIWRSVMAHLPLKKLPEDIEQTEPADRREAEKAEKSPRRVLH